MLPDNFFENLVLAPCMRVFGQKAVLNPIKSQKSGLPVEIAGVFTNKPYDIPVDDGTFISTSMPMLGINLGDFQVAPKQDDQIIFQNTVYDIINVRKDGLGGADLVLRVATPR